MEERKCSLCFTTWKKNLLVIRIDLSFQFVLLTTLFYCETQKTLNTRNAMLMCCKANKEETKPQTETVISLWLVT